MDECTIQWATTVVHEANKRRGWVGKNPSYFKPKTEDYLSGKQFRKIPHSVQQDARAQP